MSRQEEIVQEFVLEQLDELGLSGEDCDINFIPAKGRKRAQVVLAFSEDAYDEVYEVLSPYLSELAEDFSYTFSGSVNYEICVLGDTACAVDSDDSEDLEEFLESSALLDEYEDVDDPDAQYEEEGLVITTIDDLDDDYYTEEDEDERY